MYKVGIVDRYIIIYNGDTVSALESFDRDTYIVRIDIEMDMGVDRYCGSVWNHENNFGSTDDRSLDLSGSCIDEVFFKLKLAAIEFGFGNSIFDLELP